jgi:Icc-related predicted phosphoesterase
MKLKPLDYDYVVVAGDLTILPKGELLALDNGYYINKDESILIKSTSYTGRIIKKKKDDFKR